MIGLCHPYSDRSHMAKVVTIACDRDQKTGAETYMVVVGANRHSVDLCPDCHAELEKAVEPFTSVGIAMSGNAAPRQRATTDDRDYDLDTVRAWGKANGHQVSDRGRIAASVVDAWRAAGSPAGT